MTAAATELLPFPVLAEADLKAPFPWFGGKSRVADAVWERFGDVPNYCEPFFGSGAVLLNRHTEPGIETVNDLDCYVANFWRALQNDPDAVAYYADWPVNEADQCSRNLYLLKREKFRERMKTDPHYYDAKIAGWWVWGQCIWIGNGWCRDPHRQRPHLGDAGTGIHRRLPHLGDAGTGLIAYMLELATRLRRVRVCCGNWDRILTRSPTFKLGTTGIFLDPPYSKDANRSEVYATDDFEVAHAVREWAVTNGDNPELRIALCGYEGEHAMPDSWDCESFKANGGYANQGEGRGRENATRERIWFSPHCLKNKQGSLF